MHEWWEHNPSILLSILRRLRRGQRVYIRLGDRISLLVIIALLLAACGSQAPQPTGFATPGQIVEAIQAAGLEAANHAPMTRDDYGLAPYVASGVRFLIPSLCPDCGGRAFVGTPDDIARLRVYYEEMGRASAIFFSWVYVSSDGRALIQLNGDLAEDTANRYRAVLTAD